MRCLVLSALCLQLASAFSPACRATAPTARSLQMSAADSAAPLSRRAALTGAAAAAAGLMPAMPALAKDELDAIYRVKKDYPVDAQQMLANMVVATEMARGTPDMEKIVKATRSEMNDFVAFYRRQPKIAGMPSFSTLYTAINTLSGHYSSYGNKYPVPEKRRARLAQQYKEIERALARGK